MGRWRKRGVGDWWKGDWWKGRKGKRRYEDWRGIHTVGIPPPPKKILKFHGSEGFL